MSLYTWSFQGPRNPSSCTTFTLNTHWSRAATGKRVLGLCTLGRFGHVQLCGPVVCGLPGLSARGFLQAGILERIGQYWLPYLSRALYFLLPYLSPLNTWCCQNP